MKKVCDAAGIEYKALRACRRTCVSIALDEGMGAETVSKQVGHEKVSTTIDIYNKFVLTNNETISKLNNMYDFMNLGLSTVSTVSAVWKA